MKPLAQIPPLWESIKEALSDKILIILAIAAAVSVFTGMLAEGAAWGWVQGVSIYFAILVIVTVTAGNDWIKDKNFVRLQSEIKNEDISVIRGKYAATQSVDMYDVVVGDVILLETGCRVPADCILLEGNEITIDETYYNPNATNKRQIVK